MLRLIEGPLSQSRAAAASPHVLPFTKRTGCKRSAPVHPQVAPLLPTGSLPRGSQFGPLSSPVLRSRGNLVRVAS